MPSFSAFPTFVPYWGARFDGTDAAGFLYGYAGALCMDGAIGSRTAALHQSYADADASGHLYLEAADVADHVVACTRAGK